jgi:glycosyltransferase involved in cell wall biosynthesis
MKLSIILTALNEEGNIRQALENLLQALDDYKIQGEILAFDDGSKDATGTIIDEMGKKDPRISFLKHKVPLGIGTSFWEGVDCAEGDVVCWFPGDNETNAWEVLRYYPLLKDVDMVIPFIFNTNKRPLIRNFLSYTFRTIVNTTFGTNLNYTNGSVLYRISTIKQLNYRSTGFFFQADILIRQIKQGYLFAEVPFKIFERMTGSSKAVNFPSFLNVAKGYCKLLKDLYFDLPDKKDTPLVQNSVSIDRRK